MMSNNESKSELLSLTKGALSAYETYRQVLEKVEESEKVEELLKIRAEHREAFNFLKEKCIEAGEQPPKSSGAWGAFAKSVTEASKLLGDEVALRALKEGEEHGRSQFREAAGNEALPEEFRKALRQRFVPAQNRHIAALDHLLQAA